MPLDLPRLAFSFALLLPACRASMIYTTFLNDHESPCCLGQTVSGPAATHYGALVGFRQVAAAFTPATSTDLSSISAAFYFAGGPNSDALSLSVASDDGGMPGLPILAWTIQAPSPSGALAPVETIFALTLVPLFAGVQYWIVASPADANTFDVWNLNAWQLLGPGGLRAEDSGSGWILSPDDSRTLALEVHGVPEPAAWPTLLTALLITTLSTRRRRHSTAQYPARART